MIKILCCIPNMGFIHAKTFMSILKLKKPDNCEIHWATTEDSVVYHARNMFAEQAVNGSYDYVFMIDADMVLPEDTLIRLLQRNYSIVSGLCFKRRFPYAPASLKTCRVVDGEPVFEVLKDWESNELVEVEGVGCACILISTTVFTALGEINWFNPTLTFSEDYSFCMRAREKGFKIFIDTSVKIGHIGEQVVYEEHYRKSLELIGGAKDATKKG